MIFPVMCNVLRMLVKIDPDEFDIINEQFTPGIGILYGTFVALTLDILYERQGKVQENASLEASLLSLATQNILSLFRDEDKIAREATQIIADQVRVIVYRSRGAEMLNIMRSDPYARLMSLVDRYQRSKNSFSPWEEALIDGLRGEIPVLMEARARRLSDEASALPPTHFLVLILLTSLSLIGFTAATVSIQPEGDPPLEARTVFAGLFAIYVLFFNFCNDINDPFDGVYQIKRSSAASYLLQIKWLVANQPWGKDIRFDTRASFVPEFDAELVEVTGSDNKKSLASTIEKMESAENAMAAAAEAQVLKEMTVTSLPAVKTVLPSSDTFEEVKVSVNGAYASSAISQISKEISVSSPAANSEVENAQIKSMYNAPMSSDLVKTVSSDSSENSFFKDDSFNAVHSEANDEDLLAPKQEMKDAEKSRSIKIQSAKDFLPNYFRTLSGFDEDGNTSDMPSVSVPSTQSEQQTSSVVENRDVKMRMTSEYFRSVGGFTH